MLTCKETTELLMGSSSHSTADNESCELTTAPCSPAFTFPYKTMYTTGIYMYAKYIARTMCVSISKLSQARYNIL